MVFDALPGDVEINIGPELLCAVSMQAQIAVIPLQFNDGREIPAEWLAEAVLEVVDHFGAASYETQKVEGHRRHGGVLYRDNLVRVVVDVPDSAKTASG
jgi:hypothetical protein